MNPPEYKLLLIDPDPPGVEHPEAALMAGAHARVGITCTDGINPALALAAEMAFDAVILHTDSVGLVPGTDPVNQLAATGLPLLVIGTDDSEQATLEAIKRGAQEYLVKADADGAIIIQALQRAIGRIEARAHMDTILENTAAATNLLRMGGWAVDLASGKACWSDELFRMCGLEPGSVTPSVELGMQFVHPDDREAVEKALNWTVQGGKQLRIEMRILRPDSTIRHALLQGEIIRNTKQEPATLVGSFLDVTERKQCEIEQQAIRNELEHHVEERTAHLTRLNELLEKESVGRIHTEEILRRERDFNSALLDTLGALVVVLDTEGRIVRFNKACEETTGYRFEEIRGRRFFDFLLLPEETAAVKTVFTQLRAGDFPNTHQNYWLTRDGGRRFINWSNTILLNEAGAVEYVVGTGIDITERTRAEKALIRSEERHRILAYNLPGVVYQTTLGETRTTRFFNDMVYSMTGYTPEELREGGICGCEGMISVVDLPRVAEVVNNAIAANVPYKVQYRIRHKDGTTRYVIDQGRPVSDDGNTPSYIDGVIFDITERVQAEQREHQRMLELAHMSRLSTMGEMATEIAHELNQPLNAITTYSDALEHILDAELSNPVDIMQALRGIRQQAQRAGEIIRGLRNFLSRKESQRSLCDINSLIDSMINLAEIDANSSNIELIFKSGDALPPVMIEKILIEQVILNLTHNAIEAMSESDATSGELLIQTSLNNEQMIEVAVQDTGSGLPADQLDRVFEAFVTSKDSGMGMGLAISRTIIEAHGGKLTARNNALQGACFTFTLPIEDIS